MINAESSKGLQRESSGKVRTILEDFLAISSERREIIHANRKQGIKVPKVLKKKNQIVRTGLLRYLSRWRSSLDKTENIWIIFPRSQSHKVDWKDQFWKIVLWPPLHILLHACLIKHYMHREFDSIFDDIYIFQYLLKCHKLHRH